MTHFMTLLPFAAALALSTALALPAQAQTQPSKPSAAKAKTGKSIKKTKNQHAGKLKTVSGPAYASRAEAMTFADELAQRQGWPLEWTRAAVGQAHHVPTVVKLMQPPTTPFVKNWRVYRSRFLDDVRIQAGVQFWQTHRAALERAEKTYGVPAEFIVGIIGVETLYGRHMGNFKVLDALATLAFDFPANHPRAAERSAFFKRELEAFLAQQKRQNSDPRTPLGSYAGAMGLPQFMPSSLTNFAVDFDGDGRIDLTGSPVDAIGSVAHYFQAFGWKTGMPTHYPVRLDSATLDMETLMAPDILPTFPVARFVAKGAVMEGPALNHAGPLALIELLNGPDAPSYVAGTENFYVITRYNWSSYYAMAVIELADAVARQVKFKAQPEPKQ